MSRVTGLIGIDYLFADIHPRILIKFSSAPWPARHSWFITVLVIRQHREKNHFIIPLPCSLAIPPLRLFRHSPDEIGVGLFLSGACFTSSLLVSRPINLCQSPLCSPRVAWSPRALALLGTLSLPFLSSLPLSPSGPLLLHLTHPSHFPLLPALLPSSDLLCPLSCRTCSGFFPPGSHLNLSPMISLFYRRSRVLACSDPSKIPKLKSSAVQQESPSPPSSSSSSPLRFILFLPHHKGFCRLFKENADKKRRHLLPAAHQLSIISLHNSADALTPRSAQFIILEMWYIWSREHASLVCRYKLRSDRLTGLIQFWGLADKFRVYLKKTTSRPALKHSAQICLWCGCSEM